MEFSQKQILEAETDLLKSELRKSSEKINQISIMRLMKIKNIH
ncbi:hypothetical protein [Clostridium botulinum]|nr:hypothetical protein [Clostridium botulinum]EES50233.1 conserved hypothetical protein [Clostridium botulinum E1 str. 'BoNT E Beluga']